ncbi:UNVERIFIED_CONTAM: hypothetical protein GTU68_000957 [Idotea baltica]|nr:hypothetical protein [Idotea baltica]
MDHIHLMLILLVLVLMINLAKNGWNVRRGLGYCLRKFHNRNIDA